MPKMGRPTQAALDLAQMDCDVIRDDVRQEVTECKAGPRDGNRMDGGRQYNSMARKVPRGAPDEKETGDG